MSARFAIAILAVLLTAAGPACADLKQVMAEPNLEKRSKLALENAAAALRHVREAYLKGEMDEVRARAEEAQESVEVAAKALKDTGKDPRRSPKWFKRAEMETRDLARRIETVQQEMSYSDRPVLDALHAKTQQVHDELLMGLMEGKRK